MDFGNITISDVLILTIGGWMVTRIEVICREFRKVRRVLREAHPQLYKKVFENG